MPSERQEASSAATTEKHPCSGCGYMMRGGSMCGDCREYGPPRDWRWEYDPATGKHKRVPDAATTLRRLTVQTQESVTYDPERVQALYDLLAPAPRPPLPRKER